MIPELRAIRDDEAEVIRAALEMAPVAHVGEAAIAAISGLRVIGRCECGCASVNFDSSESGQRAKPIADGTAKTLRGGDVGIIVWGCADAITGLEIYDVGAGDNDLLLPVPTSISPWDRQPK